MKLYHVFGDISVHIFLNHNNEKTNELKQQNTYKQDLNYLIKFDIKSTKNIYFLLK